MRTPWCCSYLSFRPRRIDTVSSTVGSLTNTGWKRRARAASFSTCLRYSSSVVAPIQCSSPRASAGFNRLEASIAPSALPAPISVCISSMNRTIPPSALMTSCRTAFSRSSNSPRYFAPAIKRAHVEREQLLVLQAFRHVAVDDALGEAFDDGGLADARLADQHRVVLGPARQHLNCSADFLVAADDRIDLAVTRRLRQVARIFLQRVIGVFGGGAVGRAALAQRVDGRVEILRADAALGEDLSGLGILVQRQRQQQPLDGDKAVAGLLGGLLGRIEQACGCRRQIDLSCAAAGHFWQLRERVLGGF